MATPEYVVVLSEPDPVARAVGDELGTGESTGEFVDGIPVRSLGTRAVSLRRPGLHIHDERWDEALPAGWRLAGTPLVFPSVHASEQGHNALTVHPLGNPGPSAEVGGRPGRLVPTAPRRMTDALRRIADGASSVGWPATFEATHHGPELSLPAFFIEVGGVDPEHPPRSATKLIASVVRELSEDPRDRIVLGVGGGHYAPHFTDLAVRRALAFGHILPRHVLDALTEEVAREAWEFTPAATGVVYARAADAQRPVARNWGPRFRENEAPRREGTTIPGSRTGGAPAAGT